MRQLPSRLELSNMLKISLPTSLQQLFFAGGLTALMAILARAGSATAASTKVLMDLSLAGLLPAMGFGMAGTTLVSQALGRRDARDAKRWGNEVARVAALTVGVLALPAALFPGAVLPHFLRDADTIALAATPLRIMAATISIDAAAMVLQSCLIGAGDSRRVMVVSLLMQWVVFLPCAALLVLGLSRGLLEVWLLYAIYRLLQAAVFTGLWQRERWMSIKL